MVETEAHLQGDAAGLELSSREFFQVIWSFVNYVITSVVNIFDGSTESTTTTPSITPLTSTTNTTTRTSTTTATTATPTTTTSTGTPTSTTTTTTPTTTSTTTPTTTSTTTPTTTTTTATPTTTSTTTPTTTPPTTTSTTTPTTTPPTTTTTTTTPTTTSTTTPLQLPPLQLPPLQRPLRLRVTAELQHDQRVVGGSPVTGIGEFLWQVVVPPITNRSVLCGGALIDASWAVTAATCMHGAKTAIAKYS